MFSCNSFFLEVEDFSHIINNLLEFLKSLGENVEKQKMAAIATMNLLKSVSKDRESKQSKLQVKFYSIDQKYGP